MATRQYILPPGVYVNETGTRSEILAPGVYLTETVAAALAVTLLAWQPALSVPLPLAQAQVGFASVPFNPVQPSNSVTQLSWQGQSPTAPPLAKVWPGFSSVPFDKVQVNPNLVPLATYQQPLSIAAPVAKSQVGFGSVPLNTAQLAVNFTDLSWFAPLSTAVKSASFAVGQPILVNITSSIPQGWYQPLAGAPLAAKVQFSSQSQPLYVAPATDNNVTLDKWQSPLSVAPAVTKAQAGFSSVPLNTAQLFYNPTLEWQQPLSIAAPVAKAQAGFSSVPFDTAQAQPAGIAGMAWHTPLGTAPYRIAYSPQRFGYDAPRYGEIAPSPVDSTTRGSETILTDRRGAGGYSRRQHDEFLKAKHAAQAKARLLKKKPAQELREAVAIASRAAGLLGDFSPSLEPVTEALMAAATADAAHAMQAAIDAVNAARLLLEQLEDDEDDVMLLLSI